MPGEPELERSYVETNGGVGAEELLQLVNEPQRMDGGCVALGGFLRQLVAFGDNRLEDRGREGDFVARLSCSIRALKVCAMSPISSTYGS